MYLFITITAVVAAIILIILVLAQNSKGGGLAAGFASSNQIMGVRKTTDFVEKATWGFAGLIIALSIFATFASKDVSSVSRQSAIQSEVENAFRVDPNLVSPEAPAE